MACSHRQTEVFLSTYHCTHAHTDRQVLQRQADRQRSSFPYLSLLACSHRQTDRQTGRFSFIPITVGMLTQTDRQVFLSIPITVGMLTQTDRQVFLYTYHCWHAHIDRQTGLPLYLSLLACSHRQTEDFLPYLSLYACSHRQTEVFLYTYHCRHAHTDRQRSSFIPITVGMLTQTDRGLPFHIYHRRHAHTDRQRSSFHTCQCRHAHTDRSYRGRQTDRGLPSIPISVGMLTQRSFFPICYCLHTHTYREIDVFLPYLPLLAYSQ